MSDIFPFFDGIEENENNEQEFPLYKEIAWNPEKNSPIVENGEFKIVEGIEAILSWCYRALSVKRYRHEIYSWNYASELEDLIGKAYSKMLVQAEAERYVKECLLINPYIKGISNISQTFQDGTLSIACDLETIYGNTSLQEVKIGV